MNYQQKIPSTTKGLKWVHPGKLRLKSVGDHFRPKVCMLSSFFHELFFQMKNSSSVFPVCHCPCQRCSPTLLNQFEDLFGEVDFDPAFAPSARSPWDQCWGWYSCLETTRDLANSWNCALGNYGTFFATFEHLKKLTSESEDTWVTRWTTLQLVWHLYVTFVQPWHIFKTIVPLLGCRAINYLRYEWWDCNFQMRCQLGPVLKCTVFGTYQTSVDRLVG